MNELLEVAKMLYRIALRDRRAFDLLLVRGTSEDFPSAAFHAQQAVEKAMKAVLAARGVETSRTHDLMSLGKAVLDAGLPLPVSESDLLRLTPYAVGFRYDDMPLPLLTPEQARRIVESVVAWSSPIVESIS